MRDFLKSVQRFSFVLYDLFALSLSIIFAFYLRLGWPIATKYLVFLETYFVPFIAVKLVIFAAFGMYRRFWRYASIHELRILIQAVVASSLSILFVSYSLGIIPIPRSVFVVDGLLTLFLVGGMRFAGRTFSEIALYARAPRSARRALVVGAGDAGEMLVREMLKSPGLGYLPIGLIDDDERKVGIRVHGIKVLGTRGRLKDIIEENLVKEVIIAMPSVDRLINESIVNACKQAGVSCRTLPGIYDIIDGRVDIGLIRDIQIEDILGRAPVKVNIPEIDDFISGRSVIVTGAGGSIGSELCRQISHFQPSRLVIVDIAENTLYEIEQELAMTVTCPLVTVVADVKDEAKMNELLGAYRPELIFHAAAYKQVPMMEMNSRTALENNFVATMKLARAAIEHGVEKFILVSTDKAVSPVSFMGFSKALAERAVLSFTDERTNFIVVRFGNVLASNGSVVPLFKKQIATGGPITVTHPDMKRYLMTITESVQLILQAAAFGVGGDVFLLDMGKQVAIVDLAEKLIELSGVSRSKIDIEFIGVRPGEKIEEKLIRENETKVASAHEKIFRLKGANAESPSDTLDQLSEFANLIGQGRMPEIVSRMHELIPGGRSHHLARN